MIKGFAVDIDETLALTNEFWAEHHIKTYGNPENLTAKEMIEKYDFVKDVPYWQIPEAHEWVEAHINSNEAKLEIPVVPGAIEIMQTIPVACYLSNRPAHTINGTYRWQRMHGFPNREIFSENKGMDWKARKLEEMFPQVQGIIDDNDELIAALNPSYEGRIILYSQKPLKLQSSLDIVICSSLQEIGNYINN
jgi:hypothetical protein